MMNIIWKSKPAHHDTRNVTQVWFPKPSTISYMTHFDSHVFTAKAKDVDTILEDGPYRAVRELK